MVLGFVIGLVCVPANSLVQGWIVQVGGAPSVTEDVRRESYDGTIRSVSFCPSRPRQQLEPVRRTVSYELGTAK